MEQYQNCEHWTLFHPNFVNHFQRFPRSLSNIPTKYRGPLLKCPVPLLYLPPFGIFQNEIFLFHFPDSGVLHGVSIFRELLTVLWDDRDFTLTFPELWCIAPAFSSSFLSNFSFNRWANFSQLLSSRCQICLASLWSICREIFSTFESFEFFSVSPWCNVHM